MKKLVLSAVVFASCSAFADKITIRGSDTLAGAIEAAITQGVIEDQIGYIGGGSGKGEEDMVAGLQFISPMSRPVKAEALAAIEQKGQGIEEYVLGLDGISIFVKGDNTLRNLTVSDVNKLFQAKEDGSCAYTQWEQFPNSGLSGAIHLYRRDDKSGTTDAFKSLTGVKVFGNCVEMVASTDDIAEKTSTDAGAIGYAGLSGKREGNREVPIAKDANSPYVMPTVTTIRDFTYPLARKLFVYRVTGVELRPGEQALWDIVTDRSKMDPIMEDAEFVTLPSEDEE